MSDYLKDPDLNRLVEELNRASGSPDEPGLVEARPERRGRADVREGDILENALHELVRRGGSDLLLIAGTPPVVRVDGRLVTTDLPPLTNDDLRAVLVSYVGSRAAALEAEGSVDFSLRMRRTSEAGRAWRFRANIHKQRGDLAAAVRALPAEIPTIEQLNLPAVLREVVKTTRGLVLVCGPTGSGKTSTLAALIGEINHAIPLHIVTIEDPIEFEHRNDRAIVEQIEVGRDAPSFHAALRASLRQDPDVILVGEMRDLETVATALTAAETGHLILSTLHTSDAAQAIHRMVDVFPPAQQTQIRQQLALSLHAIICQQLIPRVDRRGRIPAVELLIANYAVRQHIRSDRLQNLATELTLGKRVGMIPLEDSLASLVKSGKISSEEAEMRLRHPGDLKSYMGDG